MRPLRSLSSALRAARVLPRCFASYEAAIVALVAATGLSALAAICLRHRRRLSSKFEASPHAEKSVRHLRWMTSQRTFGSLSVNSHSAEVGSKKQLSSREEDSMRHFLEEESSRRRKIVRKETCAPQVRGGKRRSRMSREHRRSLRTTPRVESGPHRAPGHRLIEARAYDATVDGNAYGKGWDGMPRARRMRASWPARDHVLASHVQCSRSACAVLVRCSHGTRAAQSRCLQAGPCALGCARALSAAAGCDAWCVQSPTPDRTRGCCG